MNTTRTYSVVRDVIVAECPDHGLPRRVGRAGDALIRGTDGRIVSDSVFRCDGCTSEDTCLDPRDIMLDPDESWHVAADGVLAIVAWEPVSDDYTPGRVPSGVLVTAGNPRRVRFDTPDAVEMAALSDARMTPGTAEHAAAYGEPMPGVHARRALTAAERAYLVALLDVDSEDSDDHAAWFGLDHAAVRALRGNLS